MERKPKYAGASLLYDYGLEVKAKEDIFDYGNRLMVKKGSIAKIDKENAKYVCSKEGKEPENRKYINVLFKGWRVCRQISGSMLQLLNEEEVE